MYYKPDSLHFASYLLSLPKQEVVLNYPNLAQSYYEIQKKQANSENQGQQYIKFDLILLYKNGPQEQITYKIVKLQRLLTLFSKINKKLTHFERTQQILRIQKSKIQKKKGMQKQQSLQEWSQLKRQIIEKGEVFLQKMVKRYHTIVAVLKIRKGQKEKLSLNHFIQYFLVNKRKQIQRRNEDLELENIKFQRQNNAKQLKKQFKQIIQQVHSKFHKVFHQTIHQLNNLSHQDKNVQDFLKGCHKFFKIQSFDLNNFSSLNPDKLSPKMLQFNQINFSMFNIFVLLKQQKYNSQQFSQNLLNFQKFQLQLSWNYYDIEDLSLSLQSFYQFLFINSSFNNQQNDNLNKKSLQEKIQQLKNKFIKIINKELLFSCRQFFQIYFSKQDLIQFQLQLGIDAMDLLLKDNESYEKTRNSKNQSDSQGHSQQKQEFINNPVEINLNKKLQQKLIQQICNSKKTQQFNISESRQVLQDFYKHHFGTIFNFLQCQKQWYFKNNETYQNNNSSLHYLTNIKWIPLLKQQSYQINRHLQGQINTFTNYLISIICTLIEPKFTYYLNSFINFNEGDYQLKNKYFNEVNKKLGHYFLYNDVKNILVYQNMSFQNVQHCHYFLKYIKNDTRSQFQQNYWLQYLNSETINLLFKQKTLKQRKNVTNNNKIFFNLKNIPVRGRYCRHIDFFDLREIYCLIYPKPYCQPQYFQCPKCLQLIQFEELIFLKEFEILLQTIKLFYIQNYSLSQFIPQKQQPHKYNKSHIIQQKMEIQKKKDRFMLKQLKLILNHNNKSVRLKGKYEIIKQEREFSRKHDLHHQRVQMDTKNENTMYIQSNAVEQDDIVEFEQQMSSEVYGTLINPNKKFRSNQKRIKKFLQNYGCSKIFIRENQLNERITQFQKQDDNWVTFEEKIQIASESLRNQWKYYKDLEKGTISI